MRLKDKVAIVTGGAGGIGRKTCELFAREGAKVVIADLELEASQKIAESLKTRGLEASATRVDITRYDQAEHLSKTTVDRFGRIDILANIAGGSAGMFLKTKHSVFSESTKERWDEVINLNLYGTLNCIRSMINHMIKRKSGKIINLASTAGMIGMQKAAEYSAAKAGIIGLTKAIAKEVGPYGINVNCVSPGIIGTERVRQMPQEMVDLWHEGIPFKRLGEPEEVASVILFLASDDASYITGANIPVTGGLVLGPKGY